MKLIVGSDHGGWSLKEHLAEYLKSLGHEVIDAGCDDEQQSVHYPLYGFRVGEAVANGEADYGIAVCTTGIGISIAANKVAGIRAALCRTEDDAVMCRKHNDANVLALGEAITDIKTAETLTGVFLSTEFEGGRHQVRTSLIENYEHN